MSVATIYIGAAVLPALVLMFYVYKKDKIEKESPRLLIRLILMGILAALLSGVLETGGMALLNGTVSTYSPLYIPILAIMIGLIEDGTKYALMKKATWRNLEFNFVFDGVVYGVTASLGFAALENVLYVIEGGLATAGVRALTSIPIHAICGVYMGHYYGIAKSAEVYGASDICAKMKRRALLIPMLIHGAYDFIVSDESELLILLFFVYVILTDFFALRAVKKYAGNDVRMF